MKFKCIKDYDVAKRDEIWTLTNYRDDGNNGGLDDDHLLIPLQRATEKSTTQLLVRKSEFVDHFIFVSI